MKLLLVGEIEACTSNCCASKHMTWQLAQLQQWLSKRVCHCKWMLRLLEGDQCQMHGICMSGIRVQANLMIMKSVNLFTVLDVANGP